MSCLYLPSSTVCACPVSDLRPTDPSVNKNKYPPVTRLVEMYYRVKATAMQSDSFEWVVVLLCCV